MFEKEKAAFQAGKRIQWFSAYWDCWKDCKCPGWFRDHCYRIHPDDEVPAAPAKYFICTERGSFDCLRDALHETERLSKGAPGSVYYVTKVVSVTCSKPGPMITNTEMLDEKCC